MKNKKALKRWRNLSKKERKAINNDWDLKVCYQRKRDKKYRVLSSEEELDMLDRIEEAKGQISWLEEDYQKRSQEYCQTLKEQAETKEKYLRLKANFADKEKSLSSIRIALKDKKFVVRTLTEILDK